MNRLVWPYAGLLLALAWPVLGVDVPVGVDTLAHIARVFVRAHIGTDPDLQRLFVMQPALVPYLGLDWLMSPLARVMDPLQLARAVTVALVWGTVLSVVVLQRVITGRLGLEPLAAGLVAYNAAVAWGFLSYVLGHILAVLGLAAWHAWRGWPAAWRLGMFRRYAWRYTSRICWRSRCMAASSCCMRWWSGGAAGRPVSSWWHSSYRPPHYLSPPPRLCRRGRSAYCTTSPRR